MTPAARVAAGRRARVAAGILAEGRVPETATGPADPARTATSVRPVPAATPATTAARDTPTAVVRVTSRVRGPVSASVTVPAFSLAPAPRVATARTGPPRDPVAPGTRPGPSASEHREAAADPADPRVPRARVHPARVRGRALQATARSGRGRSARRNGPRGTRTTAAPRRARRPATGRTAAPRRAPRPRSPTRLTRPRSAMRTGPSAPRRARGSPPGNARVARLRTAPVPAARVRARGVPTTGTAPTRGTAPTTGVVPSRS